MYLLDTNVVSELRKVKAGKANPGVVAWAADQPSTSMYLSAVTILELETGILLLERRDPAQGAALRTWFSEQVLPTFAARILPIDQSVAQQCAKLHVPNPRPQIDSMIAATALVHCLTVITRNISDFEYFGAALFNPWQE